MSTPNFLVVALSLLAVISAVSAARKHRGALLGGYSPIKNINDPYVQEIAKFAVEEHNKEEKSHLDIVKVVKGESQVVAGTNYKLIIAANDSHQYEAVVYDRPWQKYRSLTSFTLV